MPLSPTSQILESIHGLPASPSAHTAPDFSSSPLGVSRDGGQLSSENVIGSILELGSPHLRDDVSCTTTPAKLPLNKSSRMPDSPQDRDPLDMADAQAQLAQYRKRLARDLEMRERSARSSMAATGDKKRVSPIQEETIETRVEELPNPTFTTTSTESGNTIRGGVTPGVIAATPSYPFPRMQSSRKATNAGKSSSPGAAFSQSPMSPTRFKFSFLERDLPASSNTSASTFVFNPDGFATPNDSHRNRTTEYPTPNLFDLSLMLTAEPGLDAWWETVVQIMTQVYKAERVTLSIPADVTDIENVPWGQKATYNEHQEDGFSLGYMGRSVGGSSGLPDMTDTGSEMHSHPENASEAPPPRPNLSSRHSFNTFEESKDRADVSEQPGRRPAGLSRSKSYMPSAVPAKPDRPHPALNQTALQQLAAADENEAPAWEATLGQRQVTKARVLPVLQALDYEADPLIDHASVMRVLERGKVIALTRTYPYLQPGDPQEPAGSRAESDAPRKKPVYIQPETPGRRPEPSSSTSHSSKVSSSRDGGRPGRLKARFEEELHRPPSPKYEEYEQAPQSPWSQSPAPSPAVRPDPKENPFFTDAVVDEDSFNPDTTTADYSSISPPEAIGIDNSSSVLHIPLNHVLLSRMPRPFFDATPIPGSGTFGINRDSEPGVPGKTPRCDPDAAGFGDGPRVAPIAILSILSPVIPYPSNLRRSLGHLSMHLATSFSLCQHHSTLETEIAGIKRRRPHPSGFGALASDGRPIANATTLSNMIHLHPGELPTQSSLAGSMTSLSEYSGVSRSAVGSPIATPGVERAEQATLGILADRIDKTLVTTSPLPVVEDGYFSAKHTPVIARSDYSSSSTGRKGKGTVREGTSLEKRRARGSSVTSAQTPDASETRSVSDKRRSLEDSAGSSSSLSRERGDSQTSDTRSGDADVPVLKADSASSRASEGTSSHPKPSTKHRHTMLHTYGADFSTTFPSLPPSATLVSKPSLPTRSGSVMTSVSTTNSEMPPPSDRLKGLILDSLPAHVFVALPQSGEVVWVSSRYLSYRGLSVGDLVADPWGSIHEEDRDEYLKAWGHCLRTGEQFSRTVRIRRFDGAYRWFYARAVASRDKRGVIHHFLGSYMDIHDQRLAEVKAARQEQIAASEAKHKLLANLIPQIIFTATDNSGITSANEQWLSYTGQSFEDSLGLGFMDYVHPEDLAKCRFPSDLPHSRSPKKYPDRKPETPGDPLSLSDNPAALLRHLSGHVDITPTDNLLNMHLNGKANPGTSGKREAEADMAAESPISDLNGLARMGVIKVARDSNGRLSYTTEVRLRSKSGEYRWHLVRCVEIDNVDFGDGASSYFGSATDINDHKLLEAKLKEAMESKSRFLSNMSHEIRTPLIGISGMVSFLQDTQLDEEQRDYTNTIQTSANSLLMIINDILDLSKVAAGMMKLKFEWFHTRSLIEDVNELVSTMAIAKRLELNYIVDEDVPAWVKGDKIRIRQVLLNVIGNAIKFTTVGEVFSRCRVYREASESSKAASHELTLEFAIIDTGRGFTKEEAELIFKPFSQIDGSSTRQHGGSGLGLVISRQLVELHGGKMEGSAVPGKGSTFTFTAKFGLPTEEDHPQFQPSPASLAADELSQVDTVPPLPSIGPAQPSRSRTSSHASPDAAADILLASGPLSSGSSNPSSAESGLSMLSGASSVSSIKAGLVRLSEAAKATGHDLSQVMLTAPFEGTPVGVAPDPRPLVYSILIVCPQTHSREATSQHIATTLPKDVPYQISALESATEAAKVITSEDGHRFTHIVLNLPTAEEVISLVELTTRSSRQQGVTILVLSDTVQRQQVIRLASGTACEKLLREKQITFIYKPVKPSRFAVIFDPDKVRDLSVDLNRSTAQQMVENQKASYLEIEKRMGNKGYRVLLVEDNPVNQKVLTKYLKKVGVGVDIATDGMDCVDMVFSRPYGYYSLILVSSHSLPFSFFSFLFTQRIIVVIANPKLQCDLHMPRKDGYQACREVREWEKRKGKGATMPIIALSANVMSDVQDKCLAAGFSEYVTKPVDFIDLSRAMSKFF